MRRICRFRLIWLAETYWLCSMLLRLQTTLSPRIWRRVREWQLAESSAVEPRWISTRRRSFSTQAQWLRMSILALRDHPFRGIISSSHQLIPRHMRLWRVLPLKSLSSLHHTRKTRSCQRKMRYLAFKIACRRKRGMVAPRIVCRRGKALLWIRLLTLLSQLATFWN